VKSFLKPIPIILLVGFILISPKTRFLIGTASNYWGKFILSTINIKNKDKWLMDKPKWLNNKDLALISKKLVTLKDDVPIKT